MRRLIAAALVLLLTATAAPAQDRPRIVAVNYALQYLAERLAADTVEVVFPVPANVDPSFWRPSIADISAIQSADLILLNGAGFATWVDRVSLPRSKIVTTSNAFSDRFIVTESITHSHGDGGEHSHEGTATYFWLDPSLAALQAEAIATALVTRRLVSEGDAADRLAVLRADLDALDAEARATLGSLAQTAVITTHPRYQYLARAYGLEMRALEWEAGAAPTAEELAELRALMAETDARVLIWEAQPSPEALTVTAELGLQNVIFPPLAHAPGDEDYLTAFRTSLASLAAIDLSQ